MKLIGNMVVYNEIDYISYSIRSVIDYLDELIIIEGAFGETVKTCGNLRSNDGTLEILQKLAAENPKIKLHFHNDPTQLVQRDRYFQYAPKELHLMLLIDGDEVYPKDSIEKIRLLADKDLLSQADYAEIKSLIFVNDFYHCSEVSYPRLFRIDPQFQYAFSQPNHLSKISDGRVCGGKPIGLPLPDIAFFHYSYAKNPKRFIEKKKERVRLHGQFTWKISGDTIYRNDAKINEFTGEHPDIMKSHPKYGVKIQAPAQQPINIVYVEHSGIGNAILSIPVLKAIKMVLPQANIYVCTWERSARIYDGLDCVNLVYTQDPRMLMASIDHIDHLMLSPVGAMSNGLERIAKQIHKINVPGFYAKHEAEYKMQFATKLGFRGSMPSNEMALFDYNIEEAQNYIKNHNLDKFLCINAAFVKSEHWPLKHWGDCKYSRLLSFLQRQFPDHKIVFVGDKNDKGDADRIIANVQPTRESTNLRNPEAGEMIETDYGLVDEDRCLNSCGAFDDIKSTAALIKQASCVIGNDGGLMHIASSVGAKCFTIFTFTNPIKNMALGKSNAICMIPCKERNICQHGHWQQCKCLDVPYESVEGQLAKWIMKK